MVDEVERGACGFLLLYGFFCKFTFIILLSGLIDFSRFIYLLSLFSINFLGCFPTVFNCLTAVNKYALPGIFK